MLWNGPPLTGRPVSFVPLRGTISRLQGKLSEKCHRDE